MLPLAFWDTSALVPLCVPQAATASVARLSDNYKAVVWWATPVELAGALARLARMREIDRDVLAGATRLANGLAEDWHVVDPSDVLLSRAMRIVERYDLRAGDSLQLAAALDWCEDDPAGRVFLTADKKLRDAALLSGFDAPKL